MPASTMQYGTVDASGVLWKSTSVGKFSEPESETTWESFSKAAAKYKENDCVGERAIVSHTVTDKGFDKFELGEYSFISYSAWYARCEALGSGLASLPELSHNCKVVIYADTQMLWMQSAFASWRQGYVVGTIYATLGEEGALYGINQSGCALVFADGKLLKILGNIASKCTVLKRVVVFRSEDCEGATVEKIKAAGIEVSSLTELEEKGKASPKPATPASGTDTAVLMYTSGTTGNPKGVLLSHKAINVLVSATRSPTGALGAFVKPGYRYMAYLPLAHIMELAVEIALLSAGYTIGYGSTGTFIPTAPKMLHANQKGDAQASALQPDILVAAPAVLDKVYSGVLHKFAAAPSIVKKIIDGGLTAARPSQLFGALRSDWASIGGLESGKSNFDNGGWGASGCVAPFFFKKKVASLLGGKVKLVITGSAPLGVEVQKFVQTVFACPVRQGYGLTETVAGTCITDPTDNGTSVVGPPQECACIMLRDWPEGNYQNADLNNPDIGMRRGEVLIGGPMIADGYFVNPTIPDPELEAKNKEEFVTYDGIRYFCTGDVGQFTSQGNLMIIDRKKDLVKLQMGEYVALSKVENALKASSYVALPMVFATSDKSYCIALICPSPGLKSLGQGSWAELCKSPEVIKKVLADVQAVCKKAKLAKFETPSKVILIEEEWTPDNEMLTAVNKLKRKEIEKKHKAEIAAVYT